MKHISKEFPGVKALQNVDFQLLPGEIHALLGENGAGKSTLIKVLGGIYIAEEGEIFIDGKPVNINNVNAARDNGISIIHQELVQVPHMTVAENIFLGREPMGKFGIDTRKMIRESQAMLDRFDLGINAADEIYDLSIAQQQMVEIVKAISFNCRILVMDEPTSSISDREVEQLFEIMRNLVKQGVGIIYISHKMSELNEVCDRVTVLRDGTYVGTRVVAETTKDELIALMVGRELDQYYTRDHVKDTEVVLKCDHIDDGKKHHKRVNDVSFEVRKGEIVGFAGLVGAGRSETMQCVFGLTHGSTGSIMLDGKPVTIKTPVDAMNYGISLVPENRKVEGLYHIQSVSFNSTIEVLHRFISKLIVNTKLEREITQEFIDKMNTKTPSQEQAVTNLSGGNQQKVMIGRWLATEPKILILDEPTRGVDVGAKAEIYEIMNELTKQGVSIIMISSELPEIINMADRVYVMYDGRITGCIDYENVSQEAIMKLATLEADQPQNGDEVNLYSQEASKA
ncbi:MAG: sugar ABC transporter ATP-binding protein [Clostridia bacterium]|nr:sugar ABC transporter ATP-binding protein [Clostridia bacterium]